MTAMEQVENLVQQLYDPLRTAEVATIQLQLQSAQSSPEGWQLADALFQSKDQNVRFFAALTFAVRINQNGLSLSQSELLELLDKLLNWLIHLHTLGEGPLVMRRLCSTLVCLFMLPQMPWIFTMRHLLYCLVSRQVVPEPSVHSLPLSQDLLAKAAAGDVFVCVTFASTLAIEASRLNNESAHTVSVHERLGSNVEDIVFILRYVFDNKIISKETSNLLGEGLQCYQAWIHYVSLQFARSSTQIHTLQTLLQPASICIFDADAFEPAVGLFLDLFTDYEAFITPQIIEAFNNLLQGSWASARLEDLEREKSDEDSLLFGQLALAYGQCISGSYLTSPQIFGQVLEIMHRLTRTQNFDTIDAGLSNAIVDFWEKFISDASDILADETDGLSPVVEHARMQWLRAVEELSLGTRLPLNRDEFPILGMNHDFSEFRFRAAELVQESYSQFEPRVLRHLLSLAFSALSNHNEISYEDRGIQNMDSNTLRSAHIWRSLESILTLINALATPWDFNDHATRDEDLMTLFESSSFIMLINANIKIPLRLRTVTINIIGAYYRCFDHQPSSLFAVLDALIHCISHTDLMDKASSALCKLCKHNRQSLAPKLPEFINVLNYLYSFSSAKQLAKENVLAIAAALTQAQSREVDKLPAATTLLSLIEQDFRLRIQKVADQDAARAIVHSALEQILSVAKGFQVPDENPIELEVESQQVTFWTQGAGAQIQEKIVVLLTYLLGLNPHDGAALELTCEIIRLGFAEPFPGPFVFKSKVVVGLITSVSSQNPRKDVALETAAKFISSHSAGKNRDEESATSLLHFVCFHIMHLKHPHADPEDAYHCVDLLSRYIPRYIELFARLSYTELSFIFSFSLACLNGPDLLPKQIAATLWKNILDSHDVRSDAKLILHDLVMSMGPQLVTVLIMAIGGNAARSELDILCEPLKTLIFKYPQAKEWINSALFDTSFPSKRVDDAGKRRFAAQLLSLRGSKKTNAVAKTFWLTCRGTPTSYR